MRWKAWVVGLALVGTGMAGCKQQCFLSECDLHSVTNNLAFKLESDPTLGTDPPAYTGGPPPATVENPEREIRYITLAEAIAMAMENGNVGAQSIQQPGLPVDSLSTFSGRQVFGSDAIRVLALDPAIAGADIEAALAKFDTRLTGALSWSTTDQPIGSALQAFQAGGSGSINAIENQDAAFNLGLIKPLPTGGVAGITFRTDYQLTNLTAARVNPSYRPSIQFQFEQPLLQGFGVEINQLRASHPGSVLTPFQTGGRVEGILLARLRFDESRIEFERQLHVLLLNVEVAYWNLYSSYWNLYAREQGLRQAYEAWKIQREKFRVGTVAVAEEAQARGQYELFRSQRLTALDNVLEAERRLRVLVGLPVQDTHRLVPADKPTLAPYRPDWEVARQECLALRPELLLSRQDLKARQLELINQKNLLLPDVRMFATYDMNGIGSRLDGFGQENALRSLATGQFSNAQIGLRADIPLGFRDAHAGTRVARLNLERAYRALRTQELKAEHVLQQQYRQIFTNYAQIQALRSQRQAFGEQLKARSQEYSVGRGTLDVLLEAQRFWADALANEHNFIAQYNNSLATFEFAKGTILQHDNIVISEGELPECARVRAVEHERERAKALILRERADPIKYQKCSAGEMTFEVPDLPTNKPVSLPAVLAATPPTVGDEDATAAGGGIPALSDVPATKPTESLPRISDFIRPRQTAATTETAKPTGTELPPEAQRRLTTPTVGGLKPVSATQPTEGKTTDKPAAAESTFTPLPSFRLPGSGPSLSIPGTPTAKPDPAAGFTPVGDRKAVRPTVTPVEQP